jgi:hypothetical protein
METTVKNQEVIISSTHKVLSNIRESNAAAVIWNRELHLSLGNEIKELLQTDFDVFKETGSDEQISKAIKGHPVLNKFPELTDDLLFLMKEFSLAINCKDVKFELSAFSDDRCRKFHTDITDYRMLCTYAGPATMYILPEHAGKLCSCDDCDIDPSVIQRAAVPDVLIFRGGLASSDEAPPLLHKSPAVEKSGEKRLLLRIDTNEFGFI